MSAGVTGSSAAPGRAQSQAHRSRGRSVACRRRTGAEASIGRPSPPYLLGSIARCGAGEGPRRRWSGSDGAVSRRNRSRTRPRRSSSRSESPVTPNPAGSTRASGCGTCSRSARRAVTADKSRSPGCWGGEVRGYVEPARTRPIPGRLEAAIVEVEMVDIGAGVESRTARQPRRDSRRAAERGAVALRTGAVFSARGSANATAQRADSEARSQRRSEERSGGQRRHGAASFAARCLSWPAQAGWRSRFGAVGRACNGRPGPASSQLQGRGIGSQLIGEWCKLLDAHRVTGYLETDKGVNVGFFKKFGFETVSEAKVLGTRNWFMLRDAK